MSRRRVALPQVLGALVGCLVVAGCGESQDVTPQEVSASSTQEGTTLEVRYIANEGVLVECGEHGVLIDALFDRPNPAYLAPTAELLEQMEAGRPPFDGVDLVLVTHDHPDHFSAGPATRFLEGNPEAMLVAPVDAVSALRDAAEDWAAIHDRVVAIALEPGAVEDRTVAAIGLRIFRTLHSGNRAEPQNLMYLVDLGGRTVFHEGDSDGSLATFARLRLGVERIDLALVHYWFPANPDGARILERYLPASHVGLIHLPIELHETYPEKLRSVAASHDDLFLFIEPGERRILD